MSRKRWPWNVVRTFRALSLANGQITVTPEYINPWRPEQGGGPGLFTRMALAVWVARRLNRRKCSCKPSS